MFIFLFSECTLFFLRLVCGNLSRIAVKISFLWDRKHGVYEGKHHFHQGLLHDIYATLHLLFWYVNIIFIAK